MDKLSGDKDKMKIAAVIYLTLPGTPYIYYGEEIGMLGSKPDEKIREPFIWDNKDLSQNTKWIDSTNPIDDIALSLQKEENTSLYNFYKDIIHVRNSYKALSLGEMEEVPTSNREIYGAKRTYEDESMYILINGSDKTLETPLESGKYKIIYTNQREDNTKSQKITLQDEISLESKEITILLRVS